MDDALAEMAARHRAEDQRLREIVDRAQRLAEALCADIDPVRREVGTDLVEIVGELPQ